MSGPQFTPGPWAYLVGTVYSERIGERRGMVAQLSIAGKSSAERDANALLIRAAPDLYAAVDAFLELIADIENDGHKLTPEQLAEVRQHEATLAKARGEA